MDSIVVSNLKILNSSIINLMIVGALISEEQKSWLETETEVELSVVIAFWSDLIRFFAAKKCQIVALFEEKWLMMEEK